LVFILQHFSKDELTNSFFYSTTDTGVQVAQISFLSILVQRV